VSPSGGACGTCRAPILWALTPNGKKAPIDREATPAGNVLVLQPAVLGGKYLAVTLSADVLDDARTRGGLRLNHWATCPDKAEWRAKQQAKDHAEA
jgi:hypothetical protein